MDLNEYMFKRKSTRRYDLTPLKKDILDKIEEFSKNMTPLYDEIKVDYKIVGADEVKNLFPIKAPHYFIISSEKKEGYLLNVGFMFQQMDLFLSSLGLGSCWLGMAKPIEKTNKEFEFVIVLAFGKALESPYREISGFKRKDISEISNKNDPRIECVRLAPSASNGQPWYLFLEDNKVHIYSEKHGFIKSKVYEKMNKIDIGIALSYLYISNRENFKFHTEENHKDLKNYNYIGCVNL